ncbi:MAG: peptidoglycan glycosyltransferase [Ruminococcus sp.]|nr:peptidoglycan glycosyltransferase [Ruminococcus sp.]
MISKLKEISAFILALSLVSCASQPETVLTEVTLQNHAPKAEISETVQETTESKENIIIKGNIYGSDGTPLVYSKADKNGNIVRTFSDTCAVPFANILSENADGMDKTLDTALNKKNPAPVNENDSVGQSVQLTIEPNMQNSIYKYMEKNKIEGSVVVMRTDGSVAAEVSYPSFDPKDNYPAEELTNGGKYSNKAVTMATPGSCFKIMTATLAAAHGIYSLYDEGKWVDENGASIVNWDYNENPNYPVERSLFSAFLDSSNIFFAKVFDNLGYETVISDLENIFSFGNNDIVCDFGTLENNIYASSDEELKRSAFGQSNDLTTPMYLAALVREAVLGDMVKPFMVQNIVDTNNVQTVIEKGSQPYQMMGSVPYEARQSVIEGMAAVAENVGIQPFGNYSVYAKTGTAEIYKNAEYTGDYLYITGFMLNANDSSEMKPVFTNYADYKKTGSYSVVMQITNPLDFNFTFASESSHLYQDILSCVAYS